MAEVNSCKSSLAALSERQSRSCKEVCSTTEAWTSSHEIWSAEMAAKVAEAKEKEKSRRQKQESLESRLKTLTTDARKSLQSTEGLRDRILSEAAQLDKDRESCAALATQTRKLKSQTVAKREEARRIEEAIIADVAKANAEMQAVQARIDKVNSEIASCQEEQKRLDQEGRDFKAQSSAIEREQSNTLLDALALDPGDAPKDINDIVQVFESHCDAVMQEASRLRGSLEEEKRRYVKLQSTVDEADQRSSTSTKEYRELCHEHAQALKDFEAIQTQVKETRDHLIELKAVQQENDNLIRKGRKEIAESLSECAALRELVRCSRALLTEEKQGLQSETRQIFRDLEQSDLAVKKAERECGKRSAEIVALRTSQVQLEHRVQELDVELREKKSACELAEQQLDAVRKKETIISEAARLRAEEKAVRDMAVEIKARIRRARRENDENCREINRIQTIPDEAALTSKLNAKLSSLSRAHDATVEQKRGIIAALEADITAARSSAS